MSANDDDDVDDSDSDWNGSEWADEEAGEIHEDADQETGNYDESELFVAGFSVNPFDYLAAAAQGVIAKASSDLSSGEKEAQEALARYKAKIAIKEAKEAKREEEKQIRREKMRAVKIKAKTWLDKLKDNAVPVGVGIGGFALVLKLFKR